MTTISQRFQDVIAKCWADERFKAQLISNPVATLKSEGINLPAGMQVEVHENTNHQMFMVIPKPPTTIDDETLDTVAGGQMICSALTKI